MYGFIQSSIITPVVLPSNASTIAFQRDRRTRCTEGCNGWLCHAEGSPVYKLVKQGNYRTSATVGIFSATAGTAALGIYEDGTLVPSSVRSVTLSAGYLGEITLDYISKVCCKANTSITIGSVPNVINPADDTVVTTVAPTITNATLNITKLS